MSEEPDTRPEALRRLYPRRTPREPVKMPADPVAATAYARAAFSDELETLSRTPEGERNARLNVSAFSLGQLVGGGYLELDPTRDALRTVAIAIGLTPTETDATLASGLEAGQRQPRLVAELASDDEIPPVTVLRPGMTEPSEPAPLSIDERFGRIDWQALYDDESEDEWILEPIIPARRLVALFSAPKVGKSLLMLEIAVQVSRGVKVLGYTPKARRVLYVDFENDPRGDIRTRLKAMSIYPHHLDNLIYLSFPRLAHLDTVMGGLELMEAVAYYNVELVVIDTISRAVGGEENDNDTWLGFYRNTGLRLKAAGVACIRLDHTGKDATKGMRGGSAKYGDVDAVWSMRRVTDAVYELECTANRLPIMEKNITLHRELYPTLHHRVDGAGRSASDNARVEDLIAFIDSAQGIGAKVTNPEAREALKSAGRTASSDLLSKALRIRGLRYTSPEPFRNGDGMPDGTAT